MKRMICDIGIIQMHQDEMEQVALEELVARCLLEIRKKRSRLIKIIPKEYLEKLQELKDDTMRQIFENDKNTLCYFPTDEIKSDILRRLLKSEAELLFNRVLINHIKKEIKEGSLKKRFFSTKININDKLWNEQMITFQLAFESTVRGYLSNTMKETEIYLEKIKERFTTPEEISTVVNLFRKRIKKSIP